MTSISASALQSALASGEGPALLDVRTPAEFASQHVPGSTNIPLDELSTALPALREDFPADLVLVCRTGGRAEQARMMLEGEGLTARVLTGGVEALEGGAIDLAGDGRHWALDRQVRLVAGGLVVGGLVAAKTVNPKFGYLAAAIGTGLTVSALTGSCPMASVLAKMPWNQAPATA
ncbi:rhodanese-like domain-containing protein [Brevibacterium litoralis]|uniref:rhodanese-like domain-containing protein n=1 Tax=Brevibacterium litoralis TaxID=3138935 RepID=UPI0032EE5627